MQEEKLTDNTEKNERNVTKFFISRFRQFSNEKEVPEDENSEYKIPCADGTCNHLQGDYQGESS